jgi:dolichol-phosphate mannosyltransferase
MQNDTDFSRIIVVLPAYNEEKSIQKLLLRINQSFKQSHLSGKIIVVNDGSVDGTLEAVRSARLEVPLEVIDLKVNQGLANAIKEGFLAAITHSRPHDIIIVMDADNSHTPGLILRMTRLIFEGADVVIASRYQKGARIRGLSRFRVFLSWGASILFRLFAGIPGVRDYTCGYRAYRADLLLQAFEDYKTEFIRQTGFACMAEILLKLSKYDPIILEVPLILRYDQKESASKMRIGRTIRQTLAMLFKFRFGNA